MPYDSDNRLQDPILTHSRNQNVNKTLYNDLDNSDISSDLNSNNESDYFDEFEIAQDMESLNNFNNIENIQENESSDIEMHSNTLMQQNKDSTTANTSLNK
ncbi:7131_t:CDS:2 [Scutellospora calospora]|uniref:7131_t:CDS:1 n=1 Tax=Scutellospora calospora TaxID=85575 RepID=A0ACA9KN46_9GLOM|nr:7131_t:CDS:2 [Scutellospora calospora]